MYSIEELLLIENLTYIPDIKPFVYIMDGKGMTVEKYLNQIDTDALIDDMDYTTYVNGKDWRNIINAIRLNPEILKAHIAETHLDEAYKGGGGVSAVFLNKHTKEAVVAFRGTALNEWKDDFIAANEVDSLQQVNALEWYKTIYERLELEKYDVTVIGHSKGGNKAKYITILNNTPKRCISFDGQGFSDKFFEHYKKKILDRQDLIENHNVDYDYVNILMNDIGAKTYYIGFDYKKGGFAEAHCPNKFFHFNDDYTFEMRINPNGQSPEMQILDQFINSMVRSAINDKERSESNELVGKLVEKAFSIGTNDITPTSFITYLCDTVGEEKYIDNAAYLLSFALKYTKTNKEFMKALRDIMIHFKADAILNVVDMLDELVNSKKLSALINISNFLILHVNKPLVKKIQSIARKKYNAELTKEQICKVLQIVSLTKNMLKTLEINMDGSDLVIEEDEDDINEFILPENLNIVVLSGGLSNERNVSLKTGYAVRDVLIKKGHNVILLDSFMGYDIEEKHIDDAFADPLKYSLPDQPISNEVPDLWAVKKRRRDHSAAYFGPNVLQICKQSDLVFIVLHGANGENGKVQATFDLLGIDYTGCNHFSSALSSNKYIAKQILRNAGIPVPKDYIVEKHQRNTDPLTYGIEYPVIVKPNNGGIGLGITVANDRKAYLKALKEAFKWDKEAIIEEYVGGREFAVSTLDGKALPVLELLPLQSENGGVTFEGETRKQCPAQISKELEKALKEAAEAAARSLGLKQYSKSDFIVRDDDTFVCLECDSLPHLSPDSHLVTEVEQTKMSFDDFCEKVIEISLIRKYH